MHTDSNNPSKSLIKRICYPEHFKVIQTEYCDFVVWRPHDRVVLQEHFIDSAIAKAMLFFKAECFLS